MEIGIMILIMLVFFAIIGFAGFMVYKQLQKTDPNLIDSSIANDIESAQDFLPFEDIKYGMIDLGGHKYRAVVECSSTNYNLKTDKEKEVIELSFQRFINSLTFPVVFYSQTRIMDNSKMIENLTEELKSTVKRYPQMEEYANVYLNEMLNLSGHIGNNKQKKKYIIIPYEEAIELNNLSDVEKYEYSQKEIQHRASVIIDGLSSVSVKATLLDTKGVAELIYSTYHRDNYADVENIVDGEFLSLVVEGDNKEESITNDARVDWILYEAQMRIKDELLGKGLPAFMESDYKKTIEGLNELRDIVGGYYKEDTDPMEVFRSEDK